MAQTHRAFTIVEILTITAIVSVLSAILFPSFDQSHKSRITNKPNLSQIAQASIAYGADHDDRIPILANGPMRSLTNTADGQLTQYGTGRTDLWPLILQPYVKDRRVYQDPRRDDLHRIWSDKPHATSDPGYDPYGPTYRNQNRFPCFGVNYVFLSPLELEENGDPNGDTVALSHKFSEAKDPANTIFYLPSQRGATPTSPTDKLGLNDTVRGFYVVNAPGMWGLSAEKYKIIMSFTGTACSGDWCGDVDPKTPGKQKSTNFAYIEKVLGGNNVSFLDGHVKFMTDTQMAAGTNYPEAVPNGEDNYGGAVITNKKKYLWDLDGNYYGLYGDQTSSNPGRPQ